jgi:hypothetical protein
VALVVMAGMVARFGGHGRDGHRSDGKGEDGLFHGGEPFRSVKLLPQQRQGSFSGPQRQMNKSAHL